MDQAIIESVETLTFFHDPADVAPARAASGRAGDGARDEPGIGFVRTVTRSRPCPVAALDELASSDAR